jgi:hypothetical protein
MRRLLLALIAVTAVAFPAALPATLHGDAPDFSPFADHIWYHHASVLTVDAAGLMTVAGTPGTPWATLPPALVQLDRIIGNTAYGHGLTPGLVFTNGAGLPIWLVLLPYDMVVLEDPLNQSGVVYCGVDVSGTDLGPFPWGQTAPCGP